MPRLNFTPEEAGALREATKSLIREGLRIPDRRERESGEPGDVIPECTEEDEA